MDQSDDHFLNDSPLGVNFDEEPKFFDPEAAQEDFLHPQPAVEEPIYADDPVRVYLREMGAVPLLTREGELDLARRMERGKRRTKKAISRYKKKEVMEHCIEINRIENEADHLVRGLVSELFEKEKDCITLIKIKEIYEFLEDTTDRCEDVADVLQNVVVKNS
jgi:hypothetical protein